MSILNVNTIQPVGSGQTITVSAANLSMSSTSLTVSAGSASAPSISPTGDSNTGIFFPAADTVAIAEGGAEVLRVDSSGNIGINSTSPSAIVGSGKILNITNTGHSTISIQAIDSVNDRNSVLELLSSGNGGSESKIVYGDTDTTPGTSSPLVFYGRHSGTTTEKLRITSGGNVGINSTIPAAKLDICGSNSQQLHVKGLGSNGEADIWLTSQGPGNTTWRILGSTGGNTHRFRVYDDTNSLERFAIDSSGRVTMPYQPYARASSTSLVSSGNAIPLNSYNLSRGGITISGNRFTVPVAGAYVFGYHHLGNSGSGACQVEIRHNGTYVSGTRTQDTNSSNDSFGTQTVKELAASDYIEFWVIQGATHNNNDYNSMWIWLIG